MAATASGPRPLLAMPWKWRKQNILTLDGGSCLLDSPPENLKFPLARTPDYLLMLRFSMARHDSQATTTIWQAISRCLMWAVTIVCVCIGLALFKPQMNRRAKLDAQLAELRMEKDRARMALESTQKQLDWLKTDPAYLESFARDSLDLRRAGETVFQFQLAK
jgi:cell division protein FtsB